MANYDNRDLINLCSYKIGTQILYVTDDFFASVENLLSPNEVISKPQTFTENGAWMDGWESKRHNPTFDFCIIRLGYKATIEKIDVDTSYFTGNYAPAASIEGCYVNEDYLFSLDEISNLNWKEILHKSDLKGNSQNFFSSIDSETCFNLIKFSIFPDGGVARLKLYGNVVPPELNISSLYDLAFVGNGGQVVCCSDQHYGNKDNLILPGRGENMGDGWETKRSRELGHKDYAVIKLCTKSKIKFFEVDTNYFKGNYPKLVKLYSIDKEYDNDEPKNNWIQITESLEAGPHRIHKIDIIPEFETKLLEYIKLEIVPDGGIQRIRVYGFPTNS